MNYYLRFTHKHGNIYIYEATPDLVSSREMYSHDSKGWMFVNEEWDDTSWIVDFTSFPEHTVDVLTRDEYENLVFLAAI